MTKVFIRAILDIASTLSRTPKVIKLVGQIGVASMSKFLLRIVTTGELRQKVKEQNGKGKYFGQNSLFLPSNISLFLPRFLVLNNSKPLFLPRFPDICLFHPIPRGALLAKIFTLAKWYWETPALSSCFPVPEKKETWVRLIV